MAAERQREVVEVKLGDRSYQILVGTDELTENPSTWIERLFGKRATAAGRSAFVITDAHVAGLHAKAVANALTAGGWRCYTEQLPPGEQTKSLTHLTCLYDKLIEFPADRNTVVVAVGGGVIGDLAGFAAATYARGLPFVQVPTTLLAQVDSSVGGKVGVNHPRGKNMIGAFYQPQGVLIDTAVLNSLPDRDYRSGLAEVVKYGVILDEPFFVFLEEHIAGINQRDPAVLRQIVARCCRLKADVVEKDEYERTGLRAVLNYGHTFAHAFEALSGYNELLHGEAVAIGMIYASRLAERVGMIDSKLTTRQQALLSAIHLPTKLPAALKFSADEILGKMLIDKKTVGGKLRFVLPTRLGEVKLVDSVPEAEVRQVIAELGS